jgi:hypothetical protein
VTDFSLFAEKYENGLIFSAGASRRRGTPLLQFWHHEVTDCSAKTSVPKFKETNQNLKGFQRDWWDRTPSVSHWFSKLFATFAKKCFHGAMKDSRDPYLQILPSCLVRRFPGWNPRTQMRSYSEPLVPKLLKEAFIWWWDPGSTHLQQKRGPNPGHARDRFFTFC